jgi:glycosyltransferase involved in cell wall biosynthesis
VRLSARTSPPTLFVISTLVNRIFARYLKNLREQRGLDLVGAIKELVALVSSHLFVSVPYLIAFLHQASDSQVSRDVRRAFRIRQQVRVALITDTFFDINGVSLSIRRMIREAERRDIDFQVVTCLTDDERRRHEHDPEVRHFLASGRLKILTAVSSIDFPEYDGLQLRFPPLLELLKHLQEEGFTKIQISTPGTIGLGGLLSAKILQIETAATYHTCIPEYVENYTNDVTLEALAWRYMMLFYHAVDEVVVPSRFVAKLLHRRGLRKRKLLILDRWVDVDRFHPRNRTAGYWRRYGIANEDALVKFIYVGRLGVEKNLQLVAAAYRRLRSVRADVHLILVGDGPYRAELERQLVGLPVTFTGFLEGDDLPRAIATADAMVFPSTTDTWGNAPLEAQASGLPVVVSTIGGPPELMVDGVTGLKIEGHDVQALADAMVILADAPTRLRMGGMARAFAEANRVDEPFTAVLDSEAYRARLKDRRDGQADERLRLIVELPESPELEADVEDQTLEGALFG